MIMMPYDWTLDIAAAHRARKLLIPHRQYSHNDHRFGWSCPPYVRARKGPSGCGHGQTRTAFMAGRGPTSKTAANFLA